MKSSPDKKSLEASSQKSPESSLSRLSKIATLAGVVTFGAACGGGGGGSSAESPSSDVEAVASDLDDSPGIIEEVVGGEISLIEDISQESHSELEQDIFAAVKDTPSLSDIADIGDDVDSSDGIQISGNVVSSDNVNLESVEDEQDVLDPLYLQEQLEKVGYFELTREQRVAYAQWQHKESDVYTYEPIIGTDKLEGNLWDCSEYAALYKLRYGGNYPSSIIPYDNFENPDVVATEMEGWEIADHLRIPVLYASTSGHAVNMVYVGDREGDIRDPLNWVVLEPQDSGDGKLAPVSSLDLLDGDFVSKWSHYGSLALSVEGVDLGFCFSKTLLENYDYSDFFVTSEIHAGTLSRLIEEIAKNGKLSESSFVDCVPSLDFGSNDYSRLPAAAELISFFDRLQELDSVFTLEIPEDYLSKTSFLEEAQSRIFNKMLVDEYIGEEGASAEVGDIDIDSFDVSRKLSILNFQADNLEDQKLYRKVIDSWDTHSTIYDQLDSDMARGVFVDTVLNDIRPHAEVLEGDFGFNEALAIFSSNTYAGGSIDNKYYIPFERYQGNRIRTEDALYEIQDGGMNQVLYLYVRTDNGYEQVHYSELLK